MNGSNREEVKIMVIKITPKQSKQINALIKKLCCNYVDGSCLLLDDGEEHACVQCIKPVWNLLQLFQKRSPSSRQRAVCRDHAAKPSKEMSNLQVVFRTKCKKPALLPKLCCRPKAEESRRAPAQETGGASLIRFQDGVLTSDTVL